MNVTDQINSTTVTAGQRVAFRVLNVIQTEKPGDQIVGAAMLFLMLCTRFKAKPRDVLDKSSRVLYDSLSEGRGDHTRAIKTYLNMEL
jgi:hypothetical protein